MMKKYAKKLFLSLLVIFIIIKIYLLFKPHVLIWDEAVYYGMGKYLFSNGAIGIWELLRPIILPIILGFSWKIFDSFIIAKILMLCVSIGYIYFTYKIGNEIFGEEVGYFSAMIILLTPIFFLYSGYFLTGILSGFFFLGSIYFILKEKYVIAGIFSTLAFLSRFPHGIGYILLFSWIFFTNNKSKWKKLFKYSLGVMLLLIPFFVFNIFMYNGQNIIVSAIYPILKAMPHQNNPLAPTGNLAYYLIETIKNNFLFGFSLFGAIVFLKEKKRKKEKTKSFILISLILSTYFFYFSIIDNKQLRFSFAFLGLLAIITAKGIHFCFYNNIFRNKYKKYISIALILLILLSGFMYLLKIKKYVSWGRYIEEPGIVTEFYKYFKGTNNTILTSDPVPAGYTENLYLSYYLGEEDLKKVEIHELKSNNIEYIIYTPRSFGCVQNDDKCLSDFKNMKQTINEYNLIFNETYYGEKYYIYKVN